MLIPLSILSFIIFKLYKFKKLDSLLNKHNLILVCDIADYSKLLSEIFKILKFNIFDINDDLAITNYIICNSATKILLDTNGGDIHSSDRLINFILESNEKINIYVMRRAFSAGTILALSAENLYMDSKACLGPTDPQVVISKDIISIKSLMNLCEKKDKDTVSDMYLIYYYEYIRLYRENIELVTKLLNKKFRNGISKNTQKNLIKQFTSGDISHHMPFSYNSLNNYIKINNDMPNYVKDSYKLYFDLFYLFF